MANRPPLKDHFTDLEHHAMAVRAGPKATPAARLKTVQTQVKGIQNKLTAQGHYTGPIHGVLDIKTRDAIVRYQAQNGLHATGTIDKPTAAALAGAPAPIRPAGGGAGASPVVATVSKGTTSMKSNGKYWRSKVKRVPLIFAQTLGGTVASPSTSTANFSVNPQMAFRAENFVIDATTGALCTVTVPTVGSNPQIAGGTAGAAIPGAMFPPTQTACLNFAMDIAQQGNQLAFSASNTQTSLSLNFVALIFGTEAEEVDGASAEASGVAPAQMWSGVAPASAWGG